MSNRDSTAPIVVGVDGSASGHDALDWAVAEASATQRPLHIVHALDDAPGVRLPSDQVVVDPTVVDRAGKADEHAAATTVLARAASRAQSAAPDLTIISTAVIGAAVPALLRQAEGADLLVVGNGGHGGHGGRRRAGSVSLAAAARASCPVIVVHARHADNPGDASNAVGAAAAERVVVASDGSEPAAAATRYAFGVAARRRIGLTVLRAWTPPFAGYPRMVLGLPQLTRAERQQLSADLSADHQEFPEVVVELKLVRDKDNHHGRALIQESAHAALVVLGFHGPGGFAAHLAHAGRQSVLEEARCPVAVVKPRPAIQGTRTDRREWSDDEVASTLQPAAAEPVAGQSQPRPIA